MAHVHYSMMKHPFPELCGAYKPQFWIIDIEILVIAYNDSSGKQLFPQHVDIIFKVEFKITDLIAKPLPSRCLLVCGKEIVNIGDLAHKVTKPFHYIFQLTSFQIFLLVVGQYHLSQICLSL